MRRIGYLTSQYPAPSHTFVRREVAALRRRGLEIATFSVTPSGTSLGALDKEEAARTFSIQAEPLRSTVAALRALRWLGRWPRALHVGFRVRGPGIRGVLRTFAYFAEALALADTLARNHVVHLHNHFSNAGACVGVVAARLAGISWSVTVHGSADFDGEGARGLGAKVAQARFVACASDYARSQTLRRAAPQHWSRVFVARCGIDGASLAAATRGAERTREAPRILSIGRLSREKAQRGLLEAFSRVVAELPDARLRIVGEGPERGALEAERARLGLDERVELPGAVAEERIVDELAAADVFVLSSLMEGAPVSLMEAAAAGLAVVAPRLAGIPELVDDGVDGRLFTPGRFDELAEILVGLAGSAEDRERLGRAAAERARAYDIEQVIDPMQAALEAVLAGTPPTNEPG